MTATISRLVAPQHPKWASCVSVRLHGHDVTAFVSVLEDEVVRRASCGLGALQDSDLLRELFTLPDGVPVPSATLSEWGRRVTKDSRQARAKTQQQELPDLDTQSISERTMDTADTCISVRGERSHTRGGLG